MSVTQRKPIALVLCGGAGARMMPWSERRHKCLVAVDQECRPLFARHVERLHAAGFRVKANVGEVWADAFRDVARGLRIPVEIIAETGEPNGSGTTLLRLARADKVDRAYATVCGDVWYSDEWYEELREMAEFATSRAHSTVVIAGCAHDPENLAGMIEIRPITIHRYFPVTRVTEKPKRWNDGAIQAAGLTVWSRGSIDVVAGHFGNGKRVGVDMMRDMLPLAMRCRVDVQANVRSHHVPADLGTPLRYAAHVCRQYEANGKTPLGEDAAGGIMGLLNAKRILVAGNGGACAVAQHAAIDWQKAGGRDVTALADPVIGSAWSNDHGYEGALARQVERVANPGDCALVVFSASGASLNVIEAARRAREVGFHAVVAVSRADSTAWVYRHATHAVKLPFGLPRNVMDYGAIEDAMQAWAHAAAAVMAGLAPWRASMAEGGA